MCANGFAVQKTARQLLRRESRDEQAVQLFVSASCERQPSVNCVLDFFMTKTVELFKKNKHIDEYEPPKGEVNLLVIAVERSRKCAGEFITEKRALLWEALDFTRRKNGHPEQLEAITLTYCCDHCQSLPLSDSTRFPCQGVSDTMKKQDRCCFCGRCA